MNGPPLTQLLRLLRENKGGSCPPVVVETTAGLPWSRMRGQGPGGFLLCPEKEYWEY